MLKRACQMWCSSSHSPLRSIVSLGRPPKYLSRRQSDFTKIWYMDALSQDIERAQKRCLKLLYPALSYNQALDKSGLDRLDSRRDVITHKMFQEIKEPKHRLHYLLPPVKLFNSQMVLRSTYPNQLPLSKISRYGRDFIQYIISNKF